MLYNSSIIFAFVWKHEHTEKHMCPILQTTCADKGKVYGEVEGRLLTALQGKMGWYKQRGGGRESKASEDEQGGRLGSLVRCGEVVSGQLEKGEALRGRGSTQLNLIQFRAVSLHFPWGNLWLCNVGNSVFAALSTEYPEHQIIVKEGPDLQQITTVSHFPWQWIKSTQRDNKLWHNTTSSV